MKFSQYKKIIKANLDTWLKHLSYISQFIVAIAAILGLIIVVIPLYQSQLLTERNAKIQLQNDTLQTLNKNIKYQLDSNRNALISIQNENENLKLEVNKLISDSARLQQDLRILLEEKGKLLDKNTLITRELNVNKGQLEKTTQKLAILEKDFYTNVLFIFKGTLDNSGIRFNDSDGNYDLEFILSYDIDPNLQEKFDINYLPYFLIKDGIERTFISSHLLWGFSDSVVQRNKKSLNSFIDEHKEEFKSHLDFDSFRKEYQDRAGKWYKQLSPLGDDFYRHQSLQFQLEKLHIEFKDKFRESLNKDYNSVQNIINKLYK